MNDSLLDYIATKYDSRASSLDEISVVFGENGWFGMHSHAGAWEREIE